MQETEAELGYRVRPVTASDIAGLAELSRAVGAAETDSDWRERAEARRSAVVVAESGPSLIGYASGSVRIGFGEAQPAGWIEAFGVAREWRGQGLGRSLMATLFAELRGMGASRIHTVVARHDRSMAPFLREIGFREELLLCLGRDV